MDEKSLFPFLSLCVFSENDKSHNAYPVVDANETDAPHSFTIEFIFN